jgi:hypothetical protein
MVLLVLVFGSAVAAGLPLLIGVLSILGTFLTAAPAGAGHRRVRLLSETSRRRSASGSASTTRCSW